MNHSTVMAACVYAGPMTYVHSSDRRLQIVVLGGNSVRRGFITNSKCGPEHVVFILILNIMHTTRLSEDVDISNVFRKERILLHSRIRLELLLT